MTIGDLLEFSLLAGAFLLVALLVVGAVRLRPRKLRKLTARQKLSSLGHFTVTRLPVAIGFAVAIFVLGAAGLTLNSHRPPGDNSPVVTVPTRSGEATLKLQVESCESDLTGQVRTSGRKLGDSAAPTVFSDQNGRRPLPMVRDQISGSSRGSFEIEQPLARRGLLSCYVQLPVVRGARGGYEIHLELAGDMQVDTEESVPAPEAYTKGRWIWRCPAGETCPGIATIEYSIEDGTKQVIVLVLASIFGALIALLVGEVLIEWARRRFRRRGHDE